MLDAGLTTAADLEACPAPTSGRNCSDFVLVSGGLAPSRLTVVPAGGDHRLVVADVVDR